MQVKKPLKITTNKAVKTKGNFVRISTVDNTVSFIKILNELPTIKRETKKYWCGEKYYVADNAQEMKVCLIYFSLKQSQETTDEFRLMLKYSKIAQ